MKLPINVRGDLATKVHIVITHMAISDKDISNDVVNPKPIEMVANEIEVPYPVAMELMEVLDAFFLSHRKGVKLYDCHGSVMLDLETGEKYPKEET